MKPGLFDKVNCVLLKNSELKDSNFTYFTGLPKRMPGPHLLILKPGKKILLAGPLDYELTKKFANHGIQVQKFSKKEEIEKILKKELHGKIGLNYTVHSKAGFDSLQKLLKKPKIFDVSSELGKLREVKTEQEISFIKTAV
ncbi:MAG: aminopeptidase P family N-terminal domain-containing protein, partial [Candidatus Diapherotrites archaeon]|nr:aminopeptidase P family N-terminal domain-containing protein [Candidatus Diapherotrites archaeon]